MALDPIAIGGAVIGLFKSKKHYDLYYWETADNSWKFVYNGHPSQLRPLEQQYNAQGIKTQRLRAKDGKSLPPPTTPPAGYEKTGATSTNWLMIVAVVAIVGLLLFFILKRKRKK